MNLGIFFFVVALILFFFAVIGVTVIPNAFGWAFVALTLGFLLAGVPVSFKRQQ